MGGIRLKLQTYCVLNWWWPKADGNPCTCKSWLNTFSWLSSAVGDIRVVCVWGRWWQWSHGCGNGSSQSSWAVHDGELFCYHDVRRFSDYILEALFLILMWVVEINLITVCFPFMVLGLRFFIFSLTSLVTGCWLCLASVYIGNNFAACLVGFCLYVLLLLVLRVVFICISGLMFSSWAIYIHYFLSLKLKCVM